MWCVGNGNVGSGVLFLYTILIVNGFGSSVVDAYSLPSALVRGGEKRTAVSFAALRDDDDGRDWTTTRATTRILRDVSAATILSAAVLFLGGVDGAAADDSPSLPPLSPPLRAAVVEAADAAFPVLTSQTIETASPLSNAVARLLAEKVPPAALANLLDRGADALSSVSEENVAVVAGLVREAYSGGGDDGGGRCAESLPVPTAALARLTSSEGYAVRSDATKRASTARRWAAVSEAVPRAPATTETPVVCLPESAAGLETLASAQTRLVLATDRRALRELGAAGAAAAKSIPPAEALRLVPEFQKTERNVDRKAKARFETAGKSLDTALKRDVAFSRQIGKM